MKDNFPLFEEVARMLEVSFFEEKLEQLKTSTNGEGRQWLRGLMREPKNGQEPTTMVDGGTSFRLATWPSHLIVCLRVYVPCPSMPLYHSPFIGLLHGLTIDTLKQWHYKVIIRNGHFPRPRR